MPREHRHGRGAEVLELLTEKLWAAFQELTASKSQDAMVDMLEALFAVGSRMGLDETRVREARDNKLRKLGGYSRARYLTNSPLSA